MHYTNVIYIARTHCKDKIVAESSICESDQTVLNLNIIRHRYKFRSCVVDKEYGSSLGFTHGFFRLFILLIFILRHSMILFSFRAKFKRDYSVHVVPNLKRKS